jgi:hypothetical protein
LITAEFFFLLFAGGFRLAPNDVLLRAIVNEAKQWKCNDKQRDNAKKEDDLNKKNGTWKSVKK